MRKREDCCCPCHQMPGTVHCVPCCDGGLDEDTLITQSLIDLAEKWKNENKIS